MNEDPLTLPINRAKTTITVAPELLRSRQAGQKFVTILFDPLGHLSVISTNGHRNAKGTLAMTYRLARLMEPIAVLAVLSVVGLCVATYYERLQRCWVTLGPVPNGYPQPWSIGF
ncbi:hypothetical protein PENFLA_c010G10033 [Penicillium flavigenum]|uniref:Uncharacterized protein n=1 Tax=Penicillium flavigenum TaxID=254877 RepID=A0A1V6TDT1_9EURO|nr:hypothetical protein PENFLA_c010G10033 [Penicillium flavigenum]